MDACVACGCGAVTGASTHAINAALYDGDLDLAISLGLLEPAHECAGCDAACRQSLQHARAQRAAALAARERHRARNARLARRQRERAERGKPAAPAGAATPALPAAAAAALARAKARAAERSGA